MTRERAIQVLNAYQAWRHFGKDADKDASFLHRPIWGPDIPDPFEVDEAFQMALEALEEQGSKPLF